VKPYTFENSEALMQRAKKVVPGGIYGHQTPLVLTKGAYPSFFARGQGSHVWDVDGNEYIDFMCSYGPIVLGHRHPKVEEAARAMKFQVLNLDVRETQQAAIRLYESLDYQCWGEHPAYARVGGKLVRGLFYYKLLQPTAT